MQDYIIRATAGGGSVRIFIASTRDLVNESACRHNSTPVATVALGRTLTAAAMMGAMLKNDTDIITLDIRGSGELGGIVAVADSMSRVKGYTFNPHLELKQSETGEAYIQLMKKPSGKLDVAGAIGAGMLTVTQDMGLKEPVHGSVELVSGEIAEDIAYYYTVSEQTPSAVMLGVLIDTDMTVKQAGGLIVQKMPDADDAIVDEISQILANLLPMTTLLEYGHSIEDILHEVFAEFDLQILDTIYPKFYCNCSRDKTRTALATIGRNELESIQREDKGAELHCHFCCTDYVFTEDDVAELLSIVT